MTTQWIITIIILGLALGYAAYRLYRYFSKSGKKPADCDGCSSDCSGCSLNVSIRESGRKYRSGSQKQISTTGRDAQAGKRSGDSPGPGPFTKHPFS